MRPVALPGFSESKGWMGLLYKFAPKSLLKVVFELRELLKKRARSPQVMEHKPNPDETNFQAMSLTTNDASSSENTRQFTDFSQYDLYVLTGGGYMCDSDKRFILPLLDRIESAKANGKLVFMVGQGMGPIEDAEVIRRAKQVLPRVDYILTREERLTRPLLESLGVPREKVLMTGDDAIEVAYRAQKPVLGNGIGLSLRLTAYTDFD